MRIITKIEHLNAYKQYITLLNGINVFLQKSGYLRLDLPVLSPALVPESYLEVFETQFIYGSKREPLYLTPSPELFIKRLLAYGVGDCYSLGKAFRNSEPGTSKHSPEFTMLEFYKTKADYMDLARDVLELLRYMAKTITGKEKIQYGSYSISFNQWEKLTVAEAFRIYAGIQPADLYSPKRLIHFAHMKGYSIQNATYEDIFSQIYVQEIESHLGTNGHPTLLYDYPKEFAALAKLNTDGITAQRFEFYIGGVELGDAYTELTDWKEQELRFRAEDEMRLKLGKIRHPIDKGFISALQYGLVDCAGIAIGIDRLAMVFTDSKDITDTKLLYIQ